MEVREELEQAIGLPLQSQLMPFQRSNMARLAPLPRCCMSAAFLTSALSCRAVLWRCRKLVLMVKLLPLLWPAAAAQ